MERDGMNTGVWREAENKTIARTDARGRVCTLYAASGVSVMVPADASPGEIVAAVAAAAVAAERERIIALAEGVGADYEVREPQAVGYAVSYPSFADLIRKEQP